jgi:ribosomal-protein-alanine N-acetyltransferase
MQRSPDPPGRNRARPVPAGRRRTGARREAPENARAKASRVCLRPPRPDDCEEFLSLTRSSRETLRPWVYPPLDPAGFRRYLARLEEARNHGFLVCSRSDSAILGVINVNEIVRGVFQSAYLGFYLGSRFEGQGYMTEGLRLVLHTAFGPLRLHRLEANIQPENERSKALVRRCGFRREGFSRRYLKIGGRWCDHERWAILREDGPA